ncbi:conserved exported hypothetical protein [Rhodococcus sp. RD6.2]|uniref:DUF2516 family protein n=1 Tax=Rhodococcus sp. RD6.2 TaxID=260936 RepID=UPI00063B1115|nr:DUF2516 family protein [Rhodococcus sp. RD6.2]CRK52473.1 conserved exported hypothetical protein [Rhodococcus sp. RD6.2]
MTTAYTLSGLILLALWLLGLAAGAFALFHAVRQRPDAFTAVDKLSKPIWVGILVAAVLVMFLARSVVSLFGLVSVVAICVYLVDVRPRVDEVQRGPRW